MCKPCCGKYSIAMTHGLRKLEAEVAELKAQRNQNSQNSSQPPSSDGPHVKRKPPRPSSGRRRGGQPGHPAHHRTLVPVEQVNDVIVCTPTHCRRCGQALHGRRSAAPSPSSGGTPPAAAPRDRISTTPAGRVLTVASPPVEHYPKASQRRAMGRVSPVSSRSVAEPIE